MSLVKDTRHDRRTIYRGMGVSPMLAVFREFDRYLDRISRSEAFLIDPMKIASLLLVWPEYRPRFRSTSTHGRDAHATKCR